MSVRTMDKIADLSGMAIDDLHAEWRRLYRTPPPRISRDLIVRALAHRRQEKLHGGLAPVVRRKLAKLANAAAASGNLRADGPVEDDRGGNGKRSAAL